MNDSHYQILPTTPIIKNDIFEAHQLTFDFHQEVRARQDFDAYCQWYYIIAEKHRKEAIAMKNDINFLGWLCGQ